jgi:colanic acid biosynthesis protein WcaH
MKISPHEYQKILEVLPIACVDLLIIKDNKCLLLKRNNEPAKGQYWFPGGRINKSELIKDAALRKAKEETNLDCQFEKVVSVEETIFTKTNNMYCDIHTINICCLLTTYDISVFRLDSLHNDFLWVDKLNANFHPAVNRPLSLIGFH